MPVPFNDLRRAFVRQQPALEAAALDVLRGGWYVMGEHGRNFERAFAQWCGVADCVGVANGTDALQLALTALNVEPGSRVVCVANAGSYAPTAIFATSALPRFVDVDDQRLLINVDEALVALEERPAAIIVTHLYGRLAPIEQICAHAARLGIPVIEDCAQAHGASRGGRKAGSFGAISCFSFYPTKNLGALGDGGACLTSNPNLAARLRALRQYGWTEKYRIGVASGRNSRLDELQAALLLCRLPQLHANNLRRREIAARYLALINHPDLRLPQLLDDDVAHLFVLRCKRRQQLLAHLRTCGVGCDVHYPIPDHRQPAWSSDLTGLSMPVTEAAADEVLSLPCFPELEEAEVDAVIAAVNAFPVDAGEGA